MSPSSLRSKIFSPSRYTLNPAVVSGGQGDSSIGAVRPEELVRHPRGESEVLSRYAVDDVQINLPHDAPPSVLFQVWLTDIVGSNLH